jgi:pyrimidine deaminase RibD-like protein
MIAETCRHFRHVDRNQWLHLEILSPEIDCRIVGTHEILGHQFERRRPEGAHVEMHAIDPADH